MQQNLRWDPEPTGFGFSSKGRQSCVCFDLEYRGERGHLPDVPSAQIHFQSGLFNPRNCLSSNFVYLPVFKYVD
jgi:hypothetical protein